MHRLVLVLAALLLAIPASAEPTPTTVGGVETGDSLFNDCDDPGEMACISYVGGIAEVMLADTIFGFRVCMPLEATNEEAVDIVKAFLAKHPNFRHFQAAGLVAAAFAEAWPCLE